MSGKTSETRCAKCYFLACPCAGRGVCGCVCHSEPTPPEGEAVPEQRETELICDGCNVRSPFEHRCHGSRSVVAGEFTNLPCECLECKEPPAPVVSTDVEAAAKTLYEKGFRYEGPVIFACEFGVTAESAQIETIAAILSPFFAPAPPCSECATLEKVLKRLGLLTKEFYKFLDLEAQELLATQPTEGK